MPSCPCTPFDSEHDWGIGTYARPRACWGSGSRSAASTCWARCRSIRPYLAAPSADPSPYLPVSRLAYNEVFVDPVALPEFSSCPDARARWAASERRIAALRSSPLVPYEEVAALLREVLEPMARCAVGRSPSGAPGGPAGLRPTRTRNSRPTHEFRARGERARAREQRPGSLRDRVLPLLPVGRAGAAGGGDAVLPALRRLPGRFASAWVRPGLVARLLRAGRPRWRTARPVLSAWARTGASALCIPSAFARTSTASCLPRWPAPSAMPRASASTTSWACSGCS